MNRVVKAETRFRALFVEAYPALQRYARFRGLGNHDADDLVAEVLAVAWRRLDDIPEDDPIPWLFAVARNVWRNGLRSASRRQQLLRRLPRPSIEPPPSEPLGVVQAALLTLNDEDQELLRLVAWHGLMPSQVAVVLGCTPGAARVRIHRARNRPRSRPRGRNAAGRRNRYRRKDPTRRGGHVFPPIEVDELMDTLRAARPTVPDERCRPDEALFKAIVAAPSRRRRHLAVSGVAAAIVIGLVVAGQVDLGGGRVIVSGPPPAAADIAHIATTSKAAVTSSGRALLDFHVGRGSMAEQRVTGTVAFSGDDVEMVLAFGPDAAGRGSGFEARNRTVDGQFYLYDAGTWIRDTNAANVRGSDMFNADPRTLLAVLHPAAGFEVVGTEMVEGVPLRHLRATRLSELPSLNLSLGPIDARELETLDVWVGPDEVVRRLDIGTLQVSTRDPEARLTKVVGPDGRTTVRADAPPPDAARMVTTETRSTYSLRFVDLGAPIEITAPADARDVAGKG